MGVRTSFLLFFLLTLPLVSAVGFSNLPGDREVLFTPGGHVEFPVNVANAVRIRATISSPTPGDPATMGTPQDDNMLAYAKMVDAAPDSGPRQVKIVFDFPQQMRPGIYPIDVYSSELPLEEGSAIAGVASSMFRITVRVLSPDALLDITGIEVPSVAEGLQANATVRFVSRTTQDIGAVRAEFTIVNTSITGAAGPVRLPSAETGALTGVFATEHLAGGTYDVLVKVTYEGKAAEGGPAVLKIGALHVNVPDSTSELAYNATNKFQFNISNEWNQELRDVYAVVRAGGQEKKTASLNIPSFGRSAYEVYFDREPVFPEGPLPVNITITFRDYDTVSKAYVDKRESFDVTPIVVAPVVEEGMPLQQILLYGLVGLIILLLLAVFLLLRRRKPEGPAEVPRAP